MTWLPLTQWVTPRAGLSETLTALSTAPARIAYLGLSVTAQRDGFRPRLHDRLVARTGQPHMGVNAGIGGVRSVSLTFLMDTLVLAHQPTLCFIECTTGDIAGGDTALEEVSRSIEGIIRKLLGIGCRPCLLHLYRGEVDWASTHPVIAAYERVADHYGIPSINVGRCLADALARNVLDVSSILRDVVHATPTGGEVTSDLIADALSWIETHGSHAVSTSVPPPMTDGRYHRALERAATSAHCAAPPVTGRFRLLYPYIELDGSNALHFDSDDIDLKGLFLIVGPDSGSVVISTPGRDTVYDLRDRWTHYDRISTLIFEDPIAAGTHISVRPIAPARLRTIAFLGLPA